jgi:hypothetical protein
VSSVQHGEVLAFVDSYDISRDVMLRAGWSEVGACQEGADVR